MYSKCEQIPENQEEKQQLGKTTFNDISTVFSEWGCVQTSPAVVGEFVHLSQARSHLQEILHSSRLSLLKLQEELSLFKPALSVSDKEVSQAVLIILLIRRAGKARSEERIRVTEWLSNVGHGVQVSQGGLGRFTAPHRHCNSTSSHHRNHRMAWIGRN